MSERIQLVVPRISNDENTFAVVECDRTDIVQTAEQVYQAVKDAVANWALHSSSGRESVEDVPDFNVGDLANCIGDKALDRAFKNEGLNNLTVETYSDLEYHGWEFDDGLVQ